MIIGGTSIKEWELKSNKKRILEYLIKDPKFINALINEVGNYVEGDSVSCLSKLKEKAWELVPLWKDKGKEAHLFKELWKLSSGRVWWKKIAEKRKEKCKLHSMARAGNVKK